MDSIQVFDLQRMFLGDESWLFLAEIVVRTGIMYLYALLAARFIGKRGMGQMSPVEYIIVIALGSATGDSMFYPDVPLLHGMIVLTVVVILQNMIERVMQSHKKAAVMIESVPSLLIENGVINEQSMRHENLSEIDLFMQLRLAGIRHVGEVERAYLEPSGKVSVFRYAPGKEAKGRSILPEEKGAAGAEAGS